MPISAQDQAALEHATYIVAVANAVMAACRHDALRSACGLVSVAQVLAGDDAVARTTLAQIMLDAVHDLDGDVLDARLQ